jgi:hypothetical protein
MAMGQDDVGYARRSLIHRKPFGKRGISGQKRVDQYGGSLDLDLEGGMSVPGQFHRRLPTGKSGPENPNRPLRTATSRMRIDDPKPLRDVVTRSRAEVQIVIKDNILTRTR